MICIFLKSNELSIDPQRPNHTVLNLLILNVLTLVGLNFSCARVSEAMDFRYAGFGCNMCWLLLDRCRTGEITQVTPK